MLRAFRERLRSTQGFERFKRRFAKRAASLALTVLAVVGEIEQADSVRTACIGEMRRGVQVLAGGTTKRKHIVTGRDFVAFPDRVAQLEVERRTLGLFSDRGQIVLLRGEVVRGGVHHVETGGDEGFQVEAEFVESWQVAWHAGAEPFVPSKELSHVLDEVRHDGLTLVQRRFGAEVAVKAQEIEIQAVEVVVLAEFTDERELLRPHLRHGKVVNEVGPTLRAGLDAMLGMLCIKLRHAHADAAARFVAGLRIDELLVIASFMRKEMNAAWPLARQRSMNTFTTSPPFSTNCPNESGFCA